MKEEIEKMLIEILAKLHTMPPREGQFIKSEMTKEDCVDLGYQVALRDARHILKDYLLKPKD